MASHIGIDIGKKSLQVYLPIIDKSFNINNDQLGFNKLLSELTKHYQELTTLTLVFEPTGGYENKLKEFLALNAINFTTVHPNKVRAYAKAKGLLAKTDKIDSKLLHDYAKTFSLQPKESYNSVSQANLHALIQRRTGLILLKNQESNRLEHKHYQTVQSSIEEHINYLDKQIQIIEAEIKHITSTDNEIKEKMRIVTSIPGVGEVLATTLICELPEVQMLDSRKLTSLVGLAPFARESGKYKGKRSIFAGRSNLRKVLYMAAVASLRVNKKLLSFYNRLLANHKPPKVALVAIMRKLLILIATLLKNNSSWSNSYVNS